jgi:hypothetical protein
MLPFAFKKDVKHISNLFLGSIDYFVVIDYNICITTSNRLPHHAER